MAHHAIDEFVEFDETIEAVLHEIDLSETLVVVTADHRTADFYFLVNCTQNIQTQTVYSHSMSFIGYDARNTSLFDNAITPGVHGSYSKIQYSTSSNPEVTDIIGLYNSCPPW